MIIQSSNVHMSAEHEKYESVRQSSTFDSSTERLDFSQILKDSGFAGLFSHDTDAAASNTGAEGVNGEEGESTTPSILVMTENGYVFNTEDSEDNSLAQQQEITRDRLFRGLLEAISGHKVMMADINEDELASVPDELAAKAGAPYEGEQANMITMTFNVTETVEEYECSNFNSCGSVKTADGREIDFALEMSMERSYSETRTVEVTQQVRFTDPLVINFEGNAADLSDEKFNFDLNADGEDELISYFTNSGMLALDKNDDGVINDGTELFGALSGNGFADLAQYDEDGNNYIDEADSIFDDLKIWTKTLGEDKLESLADRDIGAIYLGSTETPFDLKGEDNEQNGRVRASGFYLSEAGEVGTVQQVDMVV